MYKLKTFEEFVSKGLPIDESLNLLPDYGNLNELNESHVYFNNVCDVMDKVNNYNSRKHRIYRSNISESLKQKFDKDIMFNENEKIGVNIIFSEIVKHYAESVKEEIAYYDRVISGDQESINEALYVAFGDECDILFEGFFSNLKDKAKKTLDSVKDGAKKLGDKTKEIVQKGKDKTTEVVSKLKGWAQELKSQLEERFFALVRVVKNILQKAGNSVQSFIEATFDVFSEIASNCGGLFSKVISKLGGDKMDDGETPVKVDVEGNIEPFKGVDKKEQKCFLSYVMSETLTKWKQYEESHPDILHESKISDEEVEKDIEEIGNKENGKFKQWLNTFKTTVKSVNFWKSILISLSVSIFMFILPHVLVGVFGISAPIALFIVAFINCVWSWRNFFKFIKTRRAQMKSEGKTGLKGFFGNKKTCVFFTLCVFSVCLSTFNVTKLFGPFIAEVCKILGLDSNSEGIGALLYGIAKSTNPADVFQEGKVTELTQKAHEGVDARGNDLAKSQEKLIDNLKDNPQVTDSQVKGTENFIDSVRNNGKVGSSEVYKSMEAAAQANPDMLRTHVIDTSKWGGSGPIKQAMDELIKSGQVPEGASLATFGSEATKTASGGQWGFASGIVGCSDSQAQEILNRAAEIAGKDASTIHMHSYGSGIIPSPDAITLVSAPQWNVPVPTAMFVPLFIPFFDKSLDGKFKMRFSSATRGYPAYVVSTKYTKMVNTDELKKLADNTPAVDKLISIHDNAWKESESLLKDNSVNESKSKDKKKKTQKIEEPGYVVIYVNVNEETGNDKDVEDGKTKNNKDDFQPGIVIDTLTMMCADICTFNKNRRSQPYYMKGLLSRLSFRPTKDRDNEIKHSIRELLGKTMQTCIVQNVKFGLGQKYVTVDDSDKKKPKFVVKDGINNSESSEIGNLTPQEMVDCLNDNSKTDKKSYDILDGRFATRVSVGTDKNGKPKVSVKKDETAIEFVKYYRVSSNEKQKLMDEYEKKCKENASAGKRKPAKPSFNVVKVDGKEITYKKLTKTAEKNLKLKKNQIYDFVDVKITPILLDKKSNVYKELNDNENIKKVLYPNDKLEKDVVKLLKPFLFRPEKTFSKSDEYALNNIINTAENKDKNLWDKLKDKLGWSDKKFHNIFKDIVEIIWDELSNNTRTKYGKRVDNRKTNESEEYTLFDQLVEEYLNDTCDSEEMYDNLIVEMREYEDSIIMSRKDFLSRYYL